MPSSPSAAPASTNKPTQRFSDPIDPEDLDIYDKAPSELTISPLYLVDKAPPSSTVPLPQQHMDWTSASLTRKPYEKASVFFVLATAVYEGTKRQMLHPNML